MNDSIESTIRFADSFLPHFEKAIRETAYEPGGIFFSEILFARAAIGDDSPKRIVESGRARGLSTGLLSRLFPDTEIISIEVIKESAEALYAEKQLENVENVTLLYGDANDILPKIVQQSDVVLIDGPKRVPALELALRVLSSQEISGIFIHDCYKGQALRIFLDRLVPGVFYSDHPDFVDGFRHLDEAIWRNKRSAQQDACYGTSAGRSYGPTLACLPLTRGVDYEAILADLRRSLRGYKWKRSLSKRLPFVPELPPL